MSKKITQELIKELADIEFETADYQDRDRFDSDLEYYQYSASLESYVDLLWENNVETREEAEELQHLVLREIARRVEKGEIE